MALILSAYGPHRLEDMTRDQLIEAVRYLHLQYTLQVRSRMSGPKLNSPTIAPGNERYDIFFHEPDRPTLPHDLAENS